LSRAFTGGKRQREANRDRRKKEKADRLRNNRLLRAQGIDPSTGLREGEAPAEPPAAGLPEVRLEDVVISVPSRSRHSSMGPTKLFVGGLDWNTSSQDLRAAFEKFGPVVEAIVVTDRNSGRSRGFGFVSFERAPDAELAIKTMDGAELDGRPVKVNRAEGR
jgi:RNA recognition motif-containing protein